MKSILEILAVGATIAALATSAEAATTTASNDAKVNVGTATAPAATGAPACIQGAAAMPAATPTNPNAVKPDCTTAATTGTSGNPTPTHN